MSVRLRFAPSPTGQVHIGNIRAAIFNWLYARHCGGQFLLRIEDTDLARSTPEAIRALLDVMNWLDLNYDEPELYQTSQKGQHIAAADQLLAKGAAYKHAKGGEGGGEAILFRIPWDAEAVPGVTVVGPCEAAVHPEADVVIDKTGISFATVSSKGSPVAALKCLAGFKDLEVLDAAGAVLCRLNDIIAEVLAGTRREVCKGAKTFRFTRRQITYHDQVKGDLSKPLDSLADLVIVRSDGSPVFHLGNVVDDVTQRITHIVRGDDHVENTYRHLFLFHALGASVPQYAHLPMIVNAQGKPYSKRDGDAYVGDFRDKGFMPHALFNYLALLGWSPGDNREKLSRPELIEAFTLERVKSSAAQMDMRKLTDLNGKYIAELPPAEFAAACRAVILRQPWAANGIDEGVFAKVCALVQSRTKTFQAAEQWGYFFVETPTCDEKARTTALTPAVMPALTRLAAQLAALPENGFTTTAVHAALNAVTSETGMKEHALDQPLRVAITGVTVGAGVCETAELLGQARTLARLGKVIQA